MPTFVTPKLSTMNVITTTDVFRLTCEGRGEPTLTYEWFYKNSSGKLFEYFIIC